MYTYAGTILNLYRYRSLLKLMGSHFVLLDIYLDIALFFYYITIAIQFHEIF